MAQEKTGEFRVGLVQMCTGRNVEKNVADAGELIREAARQGAQYVQTPEITTLMETERTRLFAAVRPEEGNAAIASFSLARARARHLAARRLDGRPARQRQGRQPLAPDLAGRRRSRPASTRSTCSTSSCRAARAIANPRTTRPATRPCWPSCRGARWGSPSATTCASPTSIARSPRPGADFLAIPSAFTRQTGEAHWHVLMRARAIENGCFVFAAAQAGKHETGRETYGHSLIVSPWGEIVAEADGIHPTVIVADIKSSEVQQARQRIPSLQHDRPFQVAHAAGAAGKGSLMILYRLKCKKGHEFEAWFANSTAFDTQEKRGLLSCAYCGTTQGVEGADGAQHRQAQQGQGRRQEAGRSAGRDGERGAGSARQARDPARRRAPRAGRRHAQAAGPRSRRSRNTSARASPRRRARSTTRRCRRAASTARPPRDEAKALQEEGIEFFPLPILPEDRN